MATPGSTIRVHNEIVDHDHDHWCNTCLFGTGIRMFLATSFNGQLRSMTTVLRCSECGGDNIEVNPDARHC